MKNILLIIFILAGLSINAQVWEDSLRNAQELYQSNDFDNALQLYKKAKVESGKDLFLKEELAQSAYRSGDYEMAHSSFESAIKKETDPAELSRLYYNQGNVCYKKGDMDEAIENYKKSIITDLNNQDSKYNLSQALKKKSQNQKTSPKEDNQSSDDQVNQSKGNDGSDTKKEFSMEKQAANRKLNELLKKAENTKRKVSDKSQKNNNNGKDW
ncbi:tetratricopeptide repeat protein [Crocinitomicaceae bacterium]|nr:tetratricopeptide repeat protein [Crocinitomicaceae bacterium]